jgi:hypothetical protein
MKRFSGIAIAACFALASAGASAQTTLPAGGSMHEETTTKHTEAGKNTKMKTETIIGTVKSCVAGKEIVATGPKNKNYSFDLDDNVGTSAAINNGEKVKVTYTKSVDGKRVTAIAPYTGKSSKHTTKKAA